MYPNIEILFRTHSSDEEDTPYHMSFEIPIQVDESLCSKFYGFPLGSYSPCQINTTTSLEQQYPSDQEYYIGLKKPSKRKFSIRKKSLFGSKKPPSLKIDTFLARMDD
ncbi:5992_t:CDS:2 [Dentiscutata erythropus]|uniref:5992_t:CDS:1 n=1 Tax=Dentiscutata erythropus TaxID=1348616 RepID=A0A9N9H849_9GLOM|nr:5992_t:CDS:2 [Dentiscutata erythropus]